MIDFENGLLLCANHNLIFDKYFITFDQNQNLVVINELKNKETIYNITLLNPIYFTSKNLWYMVKHQETFLKKWG